MLFPSGMQLMLWAWVILNTANDLFTEVNNVIGYASEAVAMCLALMGAALVELAGDDVDKLAEAIKLSRISAQVIVYSCFIPILFTCYDSFIVPTIQICRDSEVSWRETACQALLSAIFVPFAIFSSFFGFKSGRELELLSAMESSLAKLSENSILGTDNETVILRALPNRASLRRLKRKLFLDRVRKSKQAEHGAPTRDCTPYSAESSLSAACCRGTGKRFEWLADPDPLQNAGIADEGHRHKDEARSSSAITMKGSAAFRGAAFVGRLREPQREPPPVPSRAAPSLPRRRWLPREAPPLSPPKVAPSGELRAQSQRFDGKPVAQPKRERCSPKLSTAAHCTQLKGEVAKISAAAEGKRLKWEELLASSGADGTQRRPAPTLHDHGQRVLRTEELRNILSHLSTVSTTAVAAKPALARRVIPPPSPVQVVVRSPLTRGGAPHPAHSTSESLAAKPTPLPPAVPPPSMILTADLITPGVDGGGGLRVKPRHLLEPMARGEAASLIQAALRLRRALRVA